MNQWIFGVPWGTPYRETNPHLWIVIPSSQMGSPGHAVGGVKVHRGWDPSRRRVGLWIQAGVVMVI